MSLSVVVLPDPLRPSSTRVSPRRTLKLRSERSRCAFAARKRHAAELNDGFSRFAHGHAQLPRLGRFLTIGGIEFQALNPFI